MEHLKKSLTRELVALDFSVFSLHLILASGFIVMPLTYYGKPNNQYD